ncbi:hypothetical protein QBC40DRAFT_312475 [Triangularia verruculosa]|uniref:Uncharacterized protein n=1 Tax=Triangularia verruculosa TaxID=2587418 RepID=A0AAN6XAX1_9PEZI|nr:hypothetical protein QBC40DRAFT_312475 [Triangularia verruculosa]
MSSDVPLTEHPNGSVSSLARAKMQGTHVFSPPPVEQVQRYYTKNLPPPPDRRLSSASVLSKEMNAAFAASEDMHSLGRISAESEHKKTTPQLDTHIAVPTHVSDDVVSPQPRSALPKLWKMTGHDAFRTAISREGSLDSARCSSNNEVREQRDAGEKTEPHQRLQELERARAKGSKNSLLESTWLPSPLSDRDVAFLLQRDVSQDPATSVSDDTSMDIATALRTLEPQDRRPSGASSIDIKSKGRLGSDPRPFVPASHIVRRNKPDFPREKKVPPGPSPLKKTPRSAVHDDYAWSRGYRIPESDDHRSSHDMYHEAAVEMVSKAPPNSPGHISSTTRSSKHTPLEQIIKGLQMTEMNANASSEPSSWTYSSSHSTKHLLAPSSRPPPSSYHYHQAPRESQQLQNIRRASAISAFSAMSTTSAPQKHLHPGDRSIIVSTSTFGGPFHFHPHSPSLPHSRKPSRSSPSPSPSQKPSPPGEIGKGLDDLDGEVQADGHSSMGVGGRRTLSISGTHGTRSIPISRPGSDVVTQTITIDPKTRDRWSNYGFASPTSPKRHSSIISRVFRRSSGAPHSPSMSSGNYSTQQKGPYSQMLEQAQHQRALRQMQHQHASEVKPKTPTSPTHLSFSSIVSKAGAAATAPFKTHEERWRSKVKNKIKVFSDEGQLLGLEEGATPFKNKTEGTNNEPAARMSRRSMPAGDTRMTSIHELVGEGALAPPNDNPIWMGPGVATYVHGTSVSSTPRFVTTPSGTPGVNSIHPSTAGTNTASGTETNSVWSRAPTLSATDTPTRTTFGSITAPPPPVTATRGSTSTPPARYHRKPPAGGSDTSHSHSRSQAVGPRLGVAAAEGRYSSASSLPLPPAHIPPPFVPRSFTPQVSVLDNPLRKARGPSPRPTPSPKPASMTAESAGFSTAAAVTGGAYGGAGTGAVGLGVIMPLRTRSIIEREERERRVRGMVEVEGWMNVL